MITLRATYKDGQVHFLDKTPTGESESVIVTFLEEPVTPEKMTGEDFLKKWAGVLKGVQVGDRKEIREERLRALEKKHR